MTSEPQVAKALLLPADGSKIRIVDYNIKEKDEEDVVESAMAEFYDPVPDLKPWFRDTYQERTMATFYVDTKRRDYCDQSLQGFVQSEEPAACGQYCLYYTLSPTLPPNETCMRILESVPPSHQMFWRGDVLVVRYESHLGLGHVYKNVEEAAMKAVEEVLKKAYESQGPEFVHEEDKPFSTEAPAKIGFPSFSRIYLFQSPLDLVARVRSASTVGVIADKSIDWSDTADLSLTNAIPRISLTKFDMRCHIGVIVVPETSCTDTSLTLAEKLESSIVYEHTGYEMGSANAGTGKSILHSTLKDVRNITALRFGGSTNKTKAQLDHYSTTPERIAIERLADRCVVGELLRVNQPRAAKPPYRAIYWNCHDIATRFAVLAADDAAQRPVIQTLSALFEVSKLFSQFCIEKCVDAGVWAMNHITERSMMSARTSQSPLVPQMSPFEAHMALTSPMAIFQMARLAYNSACVTNDTKYEIFDARTDRVLWLQVLEQRFPQLLGLGLGKDKWIALRDEAKPLSRITADKWGIPEVLFTNRMRFTRS